MMIYHIFYILHVAESSCYSNPCFRKCLILQIYEMCLLDTRKALDNDYCISA